MKHLGAMAKRHILFAGVFVLFVSVSSAEDLFFNSAGAKIHYTAEGNGALAFAALKANPITAVVDPALLNNPNFFLSAYSAAGPAKGCSRELLQSAVDSYLAAQGAGDPSKMPLAAQVKYFENMTEIKKNQGLWNTPLPIAFHRSLLDADSCRTFTELIVTEGESPYVLGTRLKLENGKISEIDSLITKKGDWLFNADNYLKYSKAEDWRVLNANERVDRQALINAGNAYFDHFSDKAVLVPFGTPCARLEGGIYTTKNFDDPKASCDIGFPEDKLPIVNRSYVVDVEMGTVNIYCRFGNPPGAPDSHTFRLVNGKLRYVHTLTLNIPGVSSEQIMGRQPKVKPQVQAPGGVK